MSNNFQDVFKNVSALFLQWFVSTPISWLRTMQAAGVRPSRRYMFSKQWPCRGFHTKGRIWKHYKLGKNPQGEHHMQCRQMQYYASYSRGGAASGCGCVFSASGRRVRQRLIWTFSWTRPEALGEKLRWVRGRTGCRREQRGRRMWVGNSEQSKGTCEHWIRAGDFKRPVGMHSEEHIHMALTRWHIGWES